MSIRTKIISSLSEKSKQLNAVIFSLIAVYLFSALIVFFPDVHNTHSKKTDNKSTYKQSSNLTVFEKIECSACSLSDAFQSSLNNVKSYFYEKPKQFVSFIRKSIGKIIYILLENNSPRAPPAPAE